MSLKNSLYHLFAHIWSMLIQFRAAKDCEDGRVHAQIPVPVPFAVPCPHVDYALMLDLLYIA